MSTKLRKSNNTYITADEIASALTGGSGITYGSEPSGTENYLQVPDGDGNLVDSRVQQFGDGLFWDFVNSLDFGFGFEVQVGVQVGRNYQYLGNGLGYLELAYDSIQEAGVTNALGLAIGDFEFGNYSDLYLTVSDEVGSSLLRGAAETFRFFILPNYLNALDITETKAQFSVPMNFTNLPTSSAGLSAGDVWNNAGTLKIV